MILVYPTAPALSIPVKTALSGGIQAHHRLQSPPWAHKRLDAAELSWHTHTCRREHPRRYSWKTPPGPRGSNGIQTMLVGVLFPAVFLNTEQERNHAHAEK